MALTDTALNALKSRRHTRVARAVACKLNCFHSTESCEAFAISCTGGGKKLTFGRRLALTFKNARPIHDEAAPFVAMGQSPARKKMRDNIAGRGGAYNRTEHAKQCKQVLQFWADYFGRLAPAADLLLTSLEELRSLPV